MVEGRRKKPNQEFFLARSGVASLFRVWGVKEINLPKTPCDFRREGDTVVVGSEGSEFFCRLSRRNGIITVNGTVSGADKAGQPVASTATKDFKRLSMVGIHSEKTTIQAVVVYGRTLDTGKSIGLVFSRWGKIKQGTKKEIS